MTKKNDEKFYEQVADELRNSGPRQGLWLKALAEANGDESKAKSQYVKWSLAELEEEMKEKLLQDTAEYVRKHSPPPERIPTRKQNRRLGNIVLAVTILLILSVFIAMYLLSIRNV